MKVNFSSQIRKKAQRIECAKKEGKVVFKDVVFFSTAFNRNNAYFQVSDLMLFANKLKKLLQNFNHDLSLSGNKYLSNKDIEVVGFGHRIVDGDYEIYAEEVSTTDPEVVAYANEITGVSIELEIDEDDIKFFAGGGGAYFKRIDWLGWAWLLGEPAGSGNTRIQDIEIFAQKIKEDITDNMNEKQFTEYLETEEGKKNLKTFVEANPEIIGGYKTETNSVDKFKNENGEIIEVTSKSTYEEIAKKIKEDLIAEFGLAKPKTAKFKVGQIVELEEGQGVITNTDNASYSVESLDLVDGEYLRSGNIKEFSESDLKLSEIETSLVETEEQKVNRLDFAKNFDRIAKNGEIKSKLAEFSKVGTNPTEKISKKSKVTKNLQNIN